LRYTGKRKGCKDMIWTNLEVTEVIKQKLHMLLIAHAITAIYYQEEAASVDLQISGHSKNNIQQQCKTVPQAARTSFIFLIILKEQSLVNVILFHHSFGSCKLAFATSNNLIHFASIQASINDTFKVILIGIRSSCLSFMHLCQVNCCQQFIAHIFMYKFDYKASVSKAAVLEVNLQLKVIIFEFKTS
ncbi:hypothetical protein T02_14391, partial [Trichinella nativa]